jgi:hypothetical protein
LVGRADTTPVARAAAFGHPRKSGAVRGLGGLHRAVILQLHCLALRRGCFVADDRRVEQLTHHKSHKKCHECGVARSGSAPCPLCCRAGLQPKAVTEWFAQSANQLPGPRRSASSAVVLSQSRSITLSNVRGSNLSASPSKSAIGAVERRLAYEILRSPIRGPRLRFDGVFGQSR